MLMMTRVFGALVFGDVVIILGTLMLGYAVDGPRYANAHLALAIFACLLTCLIHVVALTFLIVTGKLTRQAVELGHLEREPRAKQTRLKAATGRWLALGILAIVFTIATGAMAWKEVQWHVLHQLAAWTVVGSNFAAFYVELRCIHEAARLTDRAFQDYNQQREAGPAIPVNEA